MRDHGRFLNELNFNDLDEFITEHATVLDTFRATAANLNIIFQDLMKDEEKN